MSWGMINLLMLVAYLGLIIYLGFWSERSSKQKETAAGFHLAERNATLPWIIMSVFASGVGTMAIIGTVGMIFHGGVVDLWFEFFWCVGTPLLTLFFVRKLRTSGIISTSDAFIFRLGHQSYTFVIILTLAVLPFSFATMLKGAGLTFTDLFPALETVKSYQFSTDVHFQNSLNKNIIPEGLRLEFKKAGVDLNGKAVVSVKKPFSVEAAKFSRDMENKKISEQLQDAFERKGESISLDAHIRAVIPGKEWSVVDEDDGREYLVVRGEKQLHFYTEAWVIIDKDENKYTIVRHGNKLKVYDTFLDPLILGALIVMIIVAAYLMVGGFKACLITDMFQGILTWAAMIIPLVALLLIMGQGSLLHGWDKVVSHYTKPKQEHILFRDVDFRDFRGLVEKLRTENKYLFRIDISIQSDLNQGKIPGQLENLFQGQGLSLSKTAMVEINQPDQSYWIIDNQHRYLIAREKYLTIKQYQIEKETLNVYYSGGATPLARHIRPKLSPETLKLLEEDGQSEKLREQLRHDLNRLLKGGSFYDEAAFKEVFLHDRTHDLINKNPKDKKLILLNRLLLEQAFKKEIQPSPSTDYLELKKVIGPTAPAANYTYSFMIAMIILNVIGISLPSQFYGSRYMAAKTEKIARQGP